jgi:hypothetical protein
MARTPTVRPSRLVSPFAALALLALAACGGSAYTRVVSVNPADASVYINGERVGQGSSRPYTFDFADCERICVQATHPDYNPETEWYDRNRLQAMIDANLPVAITLRPR